MPEGDTISKDKKCFIVSAIGDTDSEARIHGEWFLEGIVYPAFEQFPRYEIKRSDLIRVPGMIDGQIINHLMDDHLVIADMTFLNANVFYEIGIRHLAQKPIIHMYRRDVSFKIPFDVHAFRAIEFETHRPPAIKAAKVALIEYISATEELGFQVENPVTRARGNQRLEQTASPAERVLLDRIEALEARQSRYEKDPLALRSRNLQMHSAQIPANDPPAFLAFRLWLTPDVTANAVNDLAKKLMSMTSKYVDEGHEVVAVGGSEIQIRILKPIGDSVWEKLYELYSKSAYVDRVQMVSQHLIQ